MPIYRYEIITQRCTHCKTVIDVEKKPEGAKSVSLLGSPFRTCSGCGKEVVCRRYQEWQGDAEPILLRHVVRGAIFGALIAALPLLGYFWSVSQGSGRGLSEGFERFLLALGILAFVLALGISLFLSVPRQLEIWRSKRRLGDPDYQTKLARHGFPLAEPILTPEQAVWHAHAEGARALIFSPTGRSLLSWSPDTSVFFSLPSVWNADDGQAICTLPEPASPLRAAAFSPDDRHLCTGHYDGSVILWDLATAREVLRLAGHKRVGWVAYSPDGRRLWTLGFQDRLSYALPGVPTDTTIRLWDVSTGAALFTQDTGASNSMIAYAPDGRYFMIQNGIVHLWNAAGQPIGSLPSSSSVIDKAQWLFGGTALLVQTRDSIFLYDGLSLAPLVNFPNFGYDLFSPLQRLMADLDGDRVNLYQMPTGRWLHAVGTNDSTRHLSSAVFSPLGNHLAALTYDGELMLWDLAVVVSMLSVDKEAQTQPAVEAGKNK